MRYWHIVFTTIGYIGILIMLTLIQNEQELFFVALVFIGFTALVYETRGVLHKHEVLESEILRNKHLVDKLDELVK